MNTNITDLLALSRTDLLEILADRDPEVTLEMLDLLGTEELREILANMS